MSLDNVVGIAARLQTGWSGVVSRVRCLRSGTPVVTERLVPEGCWFRLMLDTYELIFKTSKHNSLG